MKARPGKPLPAALQRTLDEALAKHQRGDAEGAVAGYREVLAVAPQQLDALMNLGVELSEQGKQREALELLRRARAAAPRLAPVQLAAGNCLLELGRWDDAKAAFTSAAQLDPTQVDAWHGLGKVLIETGREAEAIAPLQRALRLDPRLATAWFSLHQAVFDDQKMGPAIDALVQAVASDPGYVWARFSLGVATGLGGKPRGAEQHFEVMHPDRSVFAGAVDSWRYAQAKRGPRTRFFVTTRSLLRHALAQATVDGLSLELGVRYGVTARWIAEAAPDRTLHGFDSFEGLPEDWHIQPRHIYSTHGEVPELPASVAIHVGLFEHTLGPFAAAHPGPVRFMHVDCDLYSATRTTLDTLGDRVGPGTVIVFDEYLINDRWREDEFKAFQEAVAQRGWSYEYLAFNLFSGQAAVRIV